MSSRPKPTKAPAKTGAATKGTKTSKPAPKTRVPTKKGGKSDPVGGPSKPVKDEPTPASSTEEEKKEQATPVQKLSVQEIKSVLSEDSNGRIHAARKPVLVVDNEKGVVRSYMTYASTSTLIDGQNPKNLQLEQIRVGVLSCVRFGKIYVVDMQGVAEGMFDELKKRFDEVEAGLFDSCMDRSITKVDKYQALVKDTDGDAYQSFYFTEEECDKFYLVILSTNQEHTEAFKAKFNVFYIED